jgi:hypothetical protein
VLFVLRHKLEQLQTCIYICKQSVQHDLDCAAAFMQTCSCWASTRLEQLHKGWV